MLSMLCHRFGDQKPTEDSNEHGDRIRNTKAIEDLLRGGLGVRGIDIDCHEHAACHHGC